MKKPKIDATIIQSELSQSAFFRSSKKSTNQHVNIPTRKQDDKSTSQHIDTSTSQNVNKSTSLHNDKSARLQVNTSTGQHSDKLTLAEMDRFTTYLKPATIKAVKLLALETDRDVYEIVQEAVAAYLREQGRG